MIVHTYNNGHLRVIADKPNTGIKIGEYIYKDVLILSENVDTSEFEEINLKEEVK